MAIQDKFNKPNTIYKITKDYDLAGSTLTIPSGCTLDFQGGSFSNGTIIGTNTKISGDVQYSIFNLSIVTGFNVEYWDVRWFGATDGNDISNILKHICSNLSQNGVPIKIVGNYKFNSPIIIEGDLTLIGNQFPNRQLTSFPESTKKNVSSITIASNITAITIVGNNATSSGISPASDTHLNIVGLKIIGADKTSTFIEYKVTGAPSRPGIIDKVEVTGLDTFIKFTDISTSGGTIYYTLPITNCNIYDCNYSLQSTNVNNQLAIGGINLSNNVIEQGAKIDLYNLFGYNKIENCLLEGQSDAIKIKLRYGHLDFIGNYFELNSGNCILSGSDPQNDSITIRGLFRQQDTQSYQFESIYIKDIDDEGILMGASYKFTKLKNKYKSKIKASQIVSTASNNTIIIFDSLDKSAIITPDYNGGSIIGNWNTVIIDSILQVTGRTFDNSSYVYSPYIAKQVNIGDKIAVTFYKSTVGAINFQFLGTGANIIKSFTETCAGAGVYTVIIDSNRTTDTVGVGFKSSTSNPQIISNCGVYTITDDSIVESFSKIPSITTNRRIGTTQQRPVLNSSDLGYQYFDTTISKYICWNGTEWVNMDGSNLNSGGIKTINLDQLDTLTNPASAPGIYLVRATSSGNPVMGIMEVVTDTNAHVINQYLFTNADPTDVTGAHVDANRSILVRTYNRNAPNITTPPPNTWGEWSVLVNNSLTQLRVGTTEQRPSLTKSDVGYQYFDTTLNKDIVYDGSEWKNIDGTPIASAPLTVII